MKIEILPPLGINELGSRQNQEDCLFPAIESEMPDYKSDITERTHERLFMVCDGMGGHDHGEVASQLVCDVLPEYLYKHWTPGDVLTDDVLREALDETFRRINALDDGSLRKMGTTLTLLCLHRGGVTMAHLGDSRIYHLRPCDRRLLYKSRDHSLVYDLFMAGEITRDEMNSYPRKNVITRAIMPGMERQPKMDVAHTTDIQPGDYFFLCSDGILERMSDAELLALLAASKDNEAKRQQLIEVTRDNADNHSAWLIQIADVESEADDDRQPSNEATARCNALLLERQTAAAEKPQSLWQRMKKWAGRLAG